MSEKAAIHLRAQSYIVTTRTGRGVSRTQLWSAQSPLPIGHPFQWVMESTATGLRVRSLAHRRDELHAAELREITGPVPEKGAEIQLPASGKPGANSVKRDASHVVSIRVRPAVAMMPAFDVAPTTGPNAANEAQILHVYSCIGHWVLESAPIANHYIARYQRKTAFSIENIAGKFLLAARVAGIAVGRAGQPRRESARDLSPEHPIELTAEELAQTTLILENRVWRFGRARVLEVPILAPGARPEDAETQWYRRALKYTGGAFALFLLLVMLIPYTPTEEPIDVIPPQVARLVLQKPKPAVAAPSAPEVAISKTVNEAPKKVQQVAVVQAFRAKALQSAVSSLLKGGMARLLAQSDFAVGNNASLQARKIFDTKSEALRPTAPDVGFDVSKAARVASLGGAGLTGAASSKGTAAAVGYGKGDRASVKGQGDSFVALDIAAASVEEGLSKDEVGAIIHQHLSEIRYCYESAMIRTPDIEGKLMMSFVIGGNGSVKSSEVKSSTLPDPRLDDCVLRRLVTWRFPSPKGGVEVAVTYPFIFKTLGR